MLVFSRKLGEQIQIGDSITITVARVTAHSVRLGIEAPRTVEVVRKELADGQAELRATAPPLELPT